MEEEAATEAKRRARNLVADALQRVAASAAAETTVTLVELPSDDMKGRIIGREGRNIRTLEHLTGVDFIIDDTPNAVVLSSFDGIRREIARHDAAEADRGRPHPPDAHRGDVLPLEGRARRAHSPGGRAGGVRGELRRVPRGAREDPRPPPLPHELRPNVLKHTLEVVQLAGIMAAEVEASVKTAKRAALLHDLGKAMTHEVEGSHAQISTQLARRYGESPAVCHAIEAHHYEVQPQTVEAVLLIAADAISARGPARAVKASSTTSSGSSRSRSSLRNHPGVEKVYALQAGREIRVLVKPTRSTTTARCCCRTRSRARSKSTSSIRARSR